MRIVYLSGSEIPSGRADSIQVMHMCEAFASLGHDLVLFAQAAPCDSDPFAYYGVRRCFEIIRFQVTRGSRYSQWRYAYRVQRAISNRKPDAAYGRHLPAVLLAAISGLPSIYEVHQPATGHGRLLECWLFRSPWFRRMISISDALRREYLRNHPILTQSQILVSQSAASPGETSMPECNWGIRRLQIGYTGNLYPGKGMELITILAAQLPAFDFHVLGGTPETIAYWRNQLADSTNVTLHGFVTPARVRRWQQDMDVLLLPCLEEIHSAAGVNIAAWTSPLKLFEYMACGKAIVASDIPVFHEAIEHGVNALLVSSDDIDAWVDTLHQLTDPEFRALLGANAWQSIARGRTWLHRAQEVLQGVS